MPDVRGLPRAFWLLFSAALIDRVGGFAIAFLAIFLTSRAHVSVAVAGVIVSLLALGGLIGAPAGGAVADRIGRKPVLVGGLLLTAASWLHVSFARGTVHIAVAVFVAGVMSSLARPAMVAAIADVVPEADRRRAFGLHYWAINLGFAVSAIAAGALAHVSWSLVFGLDAATSVVAAALLWSAMRDALPERAPVRAGESPMRAALRGFSDIARDGVFMLLVLQGFLMASAFQQSWVPLAAELERDGLSTQYGPLLAVNGVLIVLLQPTAVQVTARLRSTYVLGTGSALVGTGYFLTAFCDHGWQYALAIAVWTLGEILLASTMPAVIARLAPADRRATYQGVYMLSWSAASFAPAAGAFVLERAGSLALWGGCLAAGLVGVLVQVRLDRSPRMH